MVPLLGQPGGAVESFTARRSSERQRDGDRSNINPPICYRVDQSLRFRRDVGETLPAYVLEAAMQRILDAHEAWNLKPATSPLGHNLLIRTH